MLGERLILADLRPPCRPVRRPVDRACKVDRQLIDYGRPRLRSERENHFLSRVGQLTITVRPTGGGSSTRALNRNRDPSGDGENCVRSMAGLPPGLSNSVTGGAKLGPAS